MRQWEEEGGEQEGGQVEALAWLRVVLHRSALWKPGSIQRRLEQHTQRLQESRPSRPLWMLLEQPTHLLQQQQQQQHMQQLPLPPPLAMLQRLPALYPPSSMQWQLLHHLWALRLPSLSPPQRPPPRNQPRHLASPITCFPRPCLFPYLSQAPSLLPLLSSSLASP